MVWIVLSWMNAQLIPVEGIACRVIVKLFLVKVLSRIEHIKRDVVFQLDGDLPAVCRCIKERFAERLFVDNSVAGFAAGNQRLNRSCQRTGGRGRYGAELARIRFVSIIIAGLLRLNARFGIRNGQAHVVGLLPRTAITNEDVAVRANGSGERAGIDRRGLRAAAAVDKADRCRELRPLALVAASIELAVRNAQSLLAVGLVVKVHRNLCARERAVGNIDFAVRVGVDGGCLGYKVAAGQGDVVRSPVCRYCGQT